jgi:hypothetical protein
LTTLTGSGTVTIPNPVLYTGQQQSFYNSTGSAITISTPSGYIIGPGITANATSLSVPAGGIVTLISDGTNYETLSVMGGAITTTALTANGTVSIAPTTLGAIDNVNIGANTKGTGAFTSLTANGATTFTATTTSSSYSTGALVVSGGVGVGGNLNSNGTVVGVNVGVNTGTNSLNGLFNIQVNSANSGSPFRIDNLSQTNQYATLSVMGSTGFSITGWDNSTVLESVATSVGSGTRGLVMSAYSGPFIVQTSGRTEAMRVDTSGNVLIGTIGQLSSARVSIADASLKTSSASGLTLGTATGGANDFQFLISRSAAGSSTSYYGIQSVEQGVAYRNLALQFNGGNVGIGTSSPNRKLHVQSSGAAIQLFDASSNAGTGIFFAGSSTNKNWFIGNQYNINDALEFTPSAATGTATIGSTPVMTMLSGGNVGIGTSTPAFALDVNPGGIRAISGFATYYWTATCTAGNYIYLLSSAAGGYGSSMSGTLWVRSTYSGAVSQARYSINTFGSQNGASGSSLISYDVYGGGPSNFQLYDMGQGTLGAGSALISLYNTSGQTCSYNFTFIQDYGSNTPNYYPSPTVYTGAPSGYLIKFGNTNLNLQTGAITELSSGYVGIGTGTASPRTTLDLGSNGMYATWFSSMYAGGGQTSSADVSAVQYYMWAAASARGSWNLAGTYSGLQYVAYYNGGNNDYLVWNLLCHEGQSLYVNIVYHNHADSVSRTAAVDYSINGGSTWTNLNTQTFGSSGGTNISGTITLNTALSNGRNVRIRTYWTSGAASSSLIGIGRAYFQANGGSFQYINSLG